MTSIKFISGLITKKKYSTSFPAHIYTTEAKLASLFSMLFRNPLTCDQRHQVCFGERLKLTSTVAWRGQRLRNGLATLVKPRRASLNRSTILIRDVRRRWRSSVAELIGAARQARISCGGRLALKLSSVNRRRAAEWPSETFNTARGRKLLMEAITCRARLSSTRGPLYPLRPRSNVDKLIGPRSLIGLIYGNTFGSR